MKYVKQRQHDLSLNALYLKGPESNHEAQDPLDAVREGMVGDLSDLEKDVVESAQKDPQKASFLRFLIEGPIVGPFRAWKRVRNQNSQENEEATE